MWSSRGGVTLSREITDDYARKILACEAAEAVDLQFAYLALQCREAVNRDILVDYLIRKGGLYADDGEWTNAELFAGLEHTLQAVRSGKNVRDGEKTGRAGRMIVLD